MKTFWLYLVQKVLAYLASVTTAQWEAAVVYVLRAGRELAHLSGTDRKAWVFEQLRRVPVFKLLDNGGLNTLIEVVLKFLIKQGDLPK